MFGKKSNVRSPRRGERNASSQTRGGSSNYYRRGSTLTSGDVKDALKKRQKSQAETKIELKHEEITKRRGRYAKLALIIVIVGWFVSRQFIGGSTVIKPDDVVDQQYTALQKLADEYIATQQFSLFKPFFDEAEAAEYLQTNTPLLASVEVKAPLLSRNITINPVFRVPVFIWEDTRGSSRYIVDKEGIVIAEADGATDSELIPIIDNSGLEPEVTKPLIPANVSEFLVVLVNTLHADTNLKIDTINTTDSIKDFEIRLQEPNKYFLKVSTQRGAKEQIADLKPVLGLLSDKSITPSQYIDIRLKDRAFYK